jgi:hypothetical protein
MSVALFSELQPWAWYTEVSMAGIGESAKCKGHPVILS